MCISVDECAKTENVLSRTDSHAYSNKSFYASNPLNIDDSFELVGHGDIVMIMIMKTKMN